MKVSATTLASDSEAVIDRVISRHEAAEIRRHGKTVATIRRKAGITAGDFVKRLKQAQFTAAESAELKSAMEAANKAFADAHSH